MSSDMGDAEVRLAARRKYESDPNVAIPADTRVIRDSGVTYVLAYIRVRPSDVDKYCAP